jgi:hypothetical protein
MSDQGFTEWEILEEHTDIYEVSNREIQLQKDYGLRVDTIPYWKSIEHRRLAGQAGARVTPITMFITKESCAKGGRISRANKLTLEQELEIVNKYVPRVYNQYTLAEEYGVVQPTINAIIKRHKKTLTN